MFSGAPGFKPSDHAAEDSSEHDSQDTDSTSTSSDHVAMRRKLNAQAWRMAILVAALQPQKTAAFCTDWERECPECIIEIPGTDFTKWLSILLNVALLTMIFYVVMKWKAVTVEVTTQTVESNFHPKQGRSVACQSQATYKWWWTKPEFRALPAESSGCSFAYP